MANTRISDLTASASNLAASDLIPVVQTPNVGPVKMTGLQLAGGLLGSTTFNGSTVTTSSPVLNLSQTWNAGAVTFTGLKFNATDTASASGSLLLDLQVGGTSRLSANKNGGVNIGLGSNIGSAGQLAQVFFGNYSTSGSFPYLIFDMNAGRMGIGMGSTSELMLRIGPSPAAGTFWDSTALGSSTSRIVLDGAVSISGTDLILRRAAAATLQLGAADAAAPVAQTLLIQSGSGTDINGVAFNIGGSKSTGTGTAGLVNIQTSSRGAASGTSQNVLATVASFGPNTLSGSQAISLLDMAQTWNTSGAPTAIKLNVTNTSSPTNSFLIGLQNNGTNQFAVRADNGACFIGTPTSDLNNYTLLTISNDFYINSKSVTAGGVRLCSGTYAWAYLKSVGVSGARFQLGNATPFGWTDNAEGAAGTFDTILTRDAASTLALRNGNSTGAAQRFNVYNTYTSSTNYETFKIDWITTANTCLIGTEKGSGGGTARALALQTDGTTRLTIAATGAATFDYNVAVGSTATSSTQLTVTSTPGSYSTAIFKGGSTSGLYVGMEGTSGGGQILTGTAAGYGVISQSSNFPLCFAANGTWGASITTAGLLAIGAGVSSSFPALKRISSGNCLQVIGADNSASAGFIVGNQALATSATDGFLYVPTCAGTPTGTPTTQTGTAPIIVDTTNNKLYFYSGGQWRDAGP